MSTALTFAPPTTSTSTPGLHVRRDAPTGRHPEGRLYVLYVQKDKPVPGKRWTLPKVLEIPSVEEVLSAPPDYFGADDDRLRWASQCQRTLTHWAHQLASVA